MDFVIEDDDIDALNLILFGIPRQIYDRSDHFNNLNDMEFFRRFRLKKQTVITILHEIDDVLEFPYNLNNCVSPLNQLLVTLRYYATGSHLITIGDFGGMHTSTVSRIIVKVSEAIARLYNRIIIMPPTIEEINETVNDFYEISAFPRVIGAIDCTHIKIQSPGGEDAEIYRNRKNYFSLNAQFICDAKLKIMNVVCRWPGSTHDSTIYNNSRIRRDFEDNKFHNKFLLGDSGYPIKQYLMTPLLNTNTRAQQLYNESHIRTRNVIERLFGVLKRRFPVLAYGCRVKIDTVMTIVVATAILHNIALRENEELPPIPEEINENELNNLINMGQIRENVNIHEPVTGVQVRNNLINTYFNNL